ncbi:Spc97 / Spc98 family protein [Reticulomyxa filosa]|uniref:Spindle pole body component n=1 Tax=Reticulomyxa filosa TaxID=46433 RepID=X6P3V8_RETFI|nr:Spc97 / Spc98 family protein [Reticulomyxa filosa]|eukprot:ETO32779.1 Spc97 / Spc98 family protein [Reticulomyxa filosa]
MLKEVQSPGDNETFILQKCMRKQCIYGCVISVPKFCTLSFFFGQPLIFHEKTRAFEDGELTSSFLSSATSHVQEDYLCKDLLRVLGVAFVSNRNNFEGDYITFVLDGYGFPKVRFEPKVHGIEKALASAVESLLPLVEDTARVRKFVSIHYTYDYGMVSQALCSEMNRHLKDFNRLLVQLESKLNQGELTLQNMKFHLQRASRTMNALRILCEDIHYEKQTHSNIVSSVMPLHLNATTTNQIGAPTTNATHAPNPSASVAIKEVTHSVAMGSVGGALLNMIQKAMDTTGIGIRNSNYNYKQQIKKREKQVKLLYGELFKAACKPYFDMLANWIYRGVITDIYGEFMIQEKQHLKKVTFVVFFQFLFTFTYMYIVYVISRNDVEQ